MLKLVKYVKRTKEKHNFSHLPPKESETIPGDKLRIDLIGPYKKGKKGKPILQCNAVTFIDPATSWFEIHQISDKR